MGVVHQMTLKQRIGQWLIPKLPINRELFTELRFEANSWACEMRNRISPSYHREVLRLRGLKGISLNIGSGGRGLAGWVNTDAVRHPGDQSFPCDVRRTLPLADGSVARILAEHVVEHLNFKLEIPKVLEEFLRVLEPGGMLRIIVPDGRRFVEAYLANDSAHWGPLGVHALPLDMPTPMAMLNHVFHQGGEHHFAYDFETLDWALGKAGFTDVRRSSFGVSSDPLLAIDRSEHAAYSLYVEAMKPREVSAGERGRP
jgi:predicted SAM-dependent methyltransferase